MSGVVMNLEAMVWTWLRLQQFWCAEQAQDLVEYTLILALLVLGCVAILGIFMPSVRSIWGGTTNELSSAASTAGGS